MGDPTQNEPASDGVVWDGPAPAATVTPATSVPPEATPAAAAPATSSNDGVVWDDEKPAASTPDNAPDQGLLHGLYTHSVGPLLDSASILKKMYDEPTWEGQRKILNDTLLGMVKPQAEVAKRGAGEIADAYNSRHAGSTAGERAATYYQGAGHLLESAIPGLGPQLAQTNDDMTERPSQGAGEALGDILTALAPKVVESAKVKIGDAIDNYRNPDLKDSASHRGLTAVISQGKAGMGDNFNPKAVSADVEPLLQQELKSNPELQARITDPKATPEESYEAFEEGLDNVRKRIDQAHLDALGNVRNTPISVRPVLAAIDKSMPEGLGKFSPDDLNELRSLKARIANVKTLGDLNGLRVYLSNETSPLFKMDGVAVQRSGTLDKAMRAASAATRDNYYDGLHQATGQDFSRLKKAESNVLSAREAIANAKPGLFTKQVEFERPSTGKQKVGAVIDGATSVLKGDKKNIAGKLLQESPMAQTHADIRRFASTLPESVPGTFDSGVRTPDRPRLSNRTTPETVTAQTTPNPPPSGPSSEVGGGSPTGQLPPGSNGTIVRSRPGSIVPDGTAQLPSGPGNAPGLAQGDVHLGLPDSGSNSRVAVPGKPYPSLNRSTAVDRTSRPIYAKPGTPETSPMRVTPEGEVHIERKELKAPEKKPKKKDQ